MTENNAAAIAYRLMDGSDHAFIYNSALKSYRDSPMVRGIPNTIYFAKQHALIENFLADPRCLGIVACSVNDPTQIYGYLLGQSYPEGIAVHWVYVKQPFRNCGIARKLYETFTKQAGNAAAIYYTHRVKTVDGLLKSRPHVTFNPYLLMGV